MSERQVNYYEVLGVSRSASQSEIKNAYRRLAKERHPDHPGGSEADFSLLQEANTVLSDPERRRRHDEALDLAHAADQLAGLDFGSFDDEVSRKRRERGRGRERASSGATESGPSLGERLRGSFRRGESAEEAGGRRGRREPARRARWYEPHDFDPEPISWKSGALSFVGAFAAFLVVGQIGLWATGANVPPAFAAWALGLGPFMWILYTLAGLLSAYFAYKAAGWAAVGLVFVAALVVGGSGGPEGLVQFAAVGIGLLVAIILLGRRRDRAAWRNRRR
jgi:molecular chaperone DnaJ